MRPDLDDWLARPTIRVVHRRESTATADRLWNAASSVRLSDAALLGRLVRWRIPGTTPDMSFNQLFREPPFVVLSNADEDHVLVSGLVGRIWTIRRDYPQLEDPEEFRAWDKPGTAKVVLANWVEGTEDGRSALVSESRVRPIGRQGRLGVGVVKPLVRAFGPLVGSDGVEAAVRLAQER